MIEVIPVGAKVTIGGDVEGVVTGVMIRTGDFVQYEVTWWAGRARNCTWLDALEVAPAVEGPLRIGFATRGA